MILSGSNISLDGKMTEGTSKMITFEEIGKYLDKLELEKKFDMMGKIVEDVLYPKITVSPTDIDDLGWLRCSPRTNYACVRLTKENRALVRLWLLGEAGFESVHIERSGLNTEHGDIKLNEWIVQEPNGATAFYSDEDFRKCYHI